VCSVTAVETDQGIERIGPAIVNELENRAEIIWSTRICSAEQVAVGVSNQISLGAAPLLPLKTARVLSV
jgi:hypothetical protein